MKKNLLSRQRRLSANRGRRTQMLKHMKQKIRHRRFQFVDFDWDNNVAIAG